MDVQAQWDRLLSRLREDVDTEEVDVWFREARPRTLEGDRLVIEVANGYYVAWIVDNYLPVMRVHAPQVFGRQLDRRKRVLDVVRYLPRHLGPRLEAVRSFELDPLPLELVCHLVERLDEPLELVGRPHEDPHVEIASRGSSCVANASIA